MDPSSKERVSTAGAGTLLFSRRTLPISGGSRDGVPAHLSIPRVPGASGTITLRGKDLNVLQLNTVDEEGKLDMPLPQAQYKTLLASVFKKRERLSLPKSGCDPGVTAGSSIPYSLQVSVNFYLLYLLFGPVSALDCPPEPSEVA
ncbi:hypothetical protein H920_04172 [Fukomys damarensis]|uniref:Uncharacterized protein n=1 Tax=Fukomys damarensis TaxID=885580 RepID=A0A091DTK3_FUKDA|nr:hypothetical protein H920_04172 [Fukomys damarensis]